MPHAVSHARLNRPITRRQATKAVDGIAYATGVAGNIAVLPQIFQAWNGPAPGLAVLTWFFFIFIGLIWLTYAILHRQKPLIFSQSISICGSIAVVTGWALHNLS
ncbi:MAG TPA: hypothetical protein VLF67_00495 [Candidatus Saccharimonas sp.]|nr:hypothetical protein [Candidatus Saccharimonas sp.]